MIAKRESLPPVRVGITPERNDWRHRASCAGTDVEQFFAEGKGHHVPEVVKRVCVRCPVRQDCLDWALTFPEPHGFWGGVGPRDRRGRKPGDNIPIRLAEEATA